jgi:hypothetical protein
MMDALIRAMYGANPPPKSAELERSIIIADEALLFGRVPLSEVRQRATELFKGPFPNSTHDLAVSTALAFFKAPEFMKALSEYQILARLRVLEWAKDGKVVGPLAESFEHVLYRIYKPVLPEAPERTTMTNEEAERAPRSKVQDVRSHSTVKDLLIARTPPWNRVAPLIIDTILEAISDKGLLEAFVMHSMNAGLVPRYEALDGNTDPTVLRAQISHFLCETGDRAIPLLANALAANQMEAAKKALMLARDTFEAAMVMAKNQIAAYRGLATIYGMVGKAAEADKYARLGLVEVETLRRGPLGRALREGSAIFPADTLDKAERQLRSYLAND